MARIQSCLLCLPPITNFEFEASDIRHTWHREPRTFRVKLNLKRLDPQLAHTWKLARTSGTNLSQVVVVELTGADGTIGWGEAAPVARYKESVDTVETYCRKVDPRGLSFADVEGSMEYLETVSDGDRAAKCALNIALLDGAARRNKKPVYDFLGLGFHEKKHVTSFT